MPIPAIVAAGAMAAARIAPAVIGASGRGAATAGAARMAGSILNKPSVAFAAGNAVGSMGGDAPESRNQNFSQGTATTSPEMDSARLAYMYGLN